MASELLICYQNVARSATTVVASNEDSSFPIENSYDGFTGDFYKTGSSGTTNIDYTFASSTTADYFAYYGTDASAQNGTIKLQYHNGSTYVDAISAHTVSTDVPYVETFSSQSSTQWRVVITGDATTSWADISLGAKLNPDPGVWVGFTPTRFALADELINSITDNGQFAGRSVLRSGVKFSLDIEYQTIANMDSYYLAMLTEMQKYPFYVSWASTTYSTDVVYAWLISMPPAPVLTHRGHMSYNLDCNGVKE